MSADAPAIPAPGPFPGSYAPPIGQLRVARRPNRPPGGPLRAFQPQGHTPTTPLKPPSTPFPSATGSARSTAPPPTSIQCGRSVDDMARHPPHRCRIARNPTPVHSARGERLTYRLLQVQRSLSKESQTSAVTCPPQPHNSASRDDQPRPRSLTTTSHPRVSGVLRYPGDLQHRSGQPAHQYRVHGAAAGSGRALFDGRSRSLSGQWVHQAVFIKRLWRSLKYEAVYLHQLADGFMAQRVIDEWSSSPTRCDRARHWMVGRRRPPTAGSRRPDRRWRTGHGGQVAIAGSEGRGPAGAQSDEGSYPQCPPDQAPRPRTPTPFYRHLFLTARGALTITRIYLDLPPAGGPNLPLPTSIEMTPDASAVVTFHRNHWKGSPEYALHTAPGRFRLRDRSRARFLRRGGAVLFCSSLFCRRCGKGRASGRGRALVLCQEAAGGDRTPGRHATGHRGSPSCPARVSGLVPTQPAGRHRGPLIRGPFRSASADRRCRHSAPDYRGHRVVGNGRRDLHHGGCARGERDPAYHRTREEYAHDRVDPRAQAGPCVLFPVWP